MQAVNILRLLVGSGAAAGRNLRLIPDKEGNIPLFCAIEIGNVSVARELLLSSTQVRLSGLRPGSSYVRYFREDFIYHLPTFGALIHEGGQGGLANP